MTEQEQTTRDVSAACPVGTNGDATRTVVTPDRKVKREEKEDPPSGAGNNGGSGAAAAVAVNGEAQPPTQYHLSTDKDAYAQKIKIKGGPYAILLALQCSSSPHLLKSELTDPDGLAQAMCDSDLTLHFKCGVETFDGTWHGSIKQLKGKGLVGEARPRGGGMHRYSLTDRGRSFVDEVLRTRDNQATKEILSNMLKDHDPRISGSAADAVLNTPRKVSGGSGGGKKRRRKRGAGGGAGNDHDDEGGGKGKQTKLSSFGFAPRKRN